MATDAPDAVVTAGQYSYTPNVLGPGGSNGTYTYQPGESANINPNWASYFDSSISNPWSYPENKPSP
jgi:hypothetical protein